MNNKLITRVLFVIIAAAAIWWLIAPSDTAQKIKYYTQPLSLGDIESTVNSSGSISPVVTVDVGSELSGLISQLNVDFNDIVTRGQVIARIDDRTVQSRLKQSEADLASAQASLVQLKTVLARSEAEAALAKRELERARKMRKQNVIGEAEFDTSETNYALKLVDIEAAKASILVGQSRVLQSQSSLEQVKLDLDRTFIRSPVDGVVIDRQVDKGQAVSASLSAPTLFSIAQDLEKMQIEADVDEADIGRIKQGQNVKFTVDAFPERKFEGSVAQVRKAATVTSNVVTYKVIISVENKDLMLLPGMTANIDIILGQRSNVLRVSNSALRFSPSADYQNTNAETQNNRRAQEIAKELGLDAAQTAKLETVMDNMQKAIQALREQGPSGPPGAGGPPTEIRNSMRKLRSQMQTELQSFLSPEQMQMYQSLNQGRRQASRNSNGESSNFTRGTLWILRDNKPQRVDVRVGIADLEYSEIVSRDLKENDKVIVRAQRVSK